MGGQRLQGGIACLMAMDVIDGLEMVDVEHQQGQRTPETQRASKLQLPLLNEMAAVGKPGQIIDLRLRPQFVFEFHALGHVLHRADRPERLAGRVVVGFAAFMHMFDAAVRHQQAVGDFVGLARPQGILVGLIDHSPIFGMDCVEECFVGSAEPLRVDLEDAANLVRPGQVVFREIQFPTAEVGQSLRLLQPGFARLLQLGVGAGQFDIGSAEIVVKHIERIEQHFGAAHDMLPGFLARDLGRDAALQRGDFQGHLRILAEDMECQPFDEVPQQQVDGQHDFALRFTDDLVDLIKELVMLATVGRGMLRTDARRLHQRIFGAEMVFCIIGQRAQRGGQIGNAAA